MLGHALKLREGMFEKFRSENDLNRDIRCYPHLTNLSQNPKVAALPPQVAS
jgi:hypothetical protein